MFATTVVAFVMAVLIVCIERIVSILNDQRPALLTLPWLGLLFLTVLFAQKIDFITYMNQALIEISTALSTL